jgi:hypothetical protein
MQGHNVSLIMQFGCCCDLSNLYISVLGLVCLRASNVEMRVLFLTEEGLVDPQYASCLWALLPSRSVEACDNT